eukprot:113663-Pyramimonas_sp.AAC.1
MARRATQTRRSSGNPAELADIGHCQRDGHPPFPPGWGQPPHVEGAALTVAAPRRLAPTRRAGAGPAGGGRERRHALRDVGEVVVGGHRAEDQAHGAAQALDRLALPLAGEKTIPGRMATRRK